MGEAKSASSNKFWIAVTAIILAVIVVAVGTYFAGSYMEQREAKPESRVSSD